MKTAVVGAMICAKWQTNANIIAFCELFKDVNLYKGNGARDA